MRNKYVTNHVLLRNETYYFLKRVAYDLKDYYSVKRLCFSLKTKPYSSALRITKSVRVRAIDNEDLVGYILNEMKELSDWTARNPL